MTQRRQVLIVGQSHVVALIHGYESQIRSDPGQFDELGISFVRKRKDDLVQSAWGSDGLVRQRKRQPLVKLMEGIEPTHLALVWGGNQMNVRSLIASERPFDVMLPSGNGSSSVDPKVELIPCSVFESAVRQRLEANASLQAVLVAADRLKVSVSVLGTPPPVPESAVRERLASSPHFVEVLQNRESDASDVAIVPDNVRAKLWMLLLSAYRRFSTDHGVDFLEPPTAAVDGAGMMGADYWSPDPTHANAAYGSLCLESVIHWVKGGNR